MTGPFTEADARAACQRLIELAPEQTRHEIGDYDIKLMIAAIDAAYRSAASRPDGWVACPKEPDAEQIRKSSVAWSAADATGVVRAMLAASPYTLKDEGR